VVPSPAADTRGARAGSPTIDENPIFKTINRTIAAYANFFWDAFTALKVNGISGDYVEFGSWGGQTLRLAHEALQGWGDLGTPRHLWAFDSFQGLPQPEDPRDVHPGWTFGGDGPGGIENFYKDCDGHGVPRDAYTAIEGYYADSLPPLGDDQPPTDIALALLDCNLYSSTVTALEVLAPRLKHGMILAVDDYYLWSSTEVSGERAALREFEATHPQWHLHRYRDIAYGGVAFVVESTAALPPNRPAGG
jgi:hypothetical protein